MPDSFFFPQYHSRAAGTWASMEWLLDDDIDALIDAARGAGDIERQNEIYRELQRKLVDVQSDVFLLMQTSQVAMSDCLANFTWVPMQSFEYDFHTMKRTCGEWAPSWSGASGRCSATGHDSVRDLTQTVDPSR